MKGRVARKDTRDETDFRGEKKRRPHRRKKEAEWNGEGRIYWKSEANKGKEKKELLNSRHEPRKRKEGGQQENGGGENENGREEKGGSVKEITKSFAKGIGGKSGRLKWVRHKEREGITSELQRER